MVWHKSIPLTALRLVTARVFTVVVLWLSLSPFCATILSAQSAQAKAAPCDAAEYRQFDFWIGDWEVHDPAGNVVGANKVTREQDGCLLVEHWTSSRAKETGTSFNYYDIRDKKWHQLYLSNSGNAGAFPAMAGQLKDGKMVLISDESATPVFRWTWYVISPGHVRQMAERSNDSQKSWKVIWDSIYVDASHAKN
jgi:hypothetical protein